MNIVVRCIPVKWSVVVNTTNEKRYNVEAKRPDIELNFFFRIRNIFFFRSSFFNHFMNFEEYMFDFSRVNSL